MKYCIIFLLCSFTLLGSESFGQNKRKRILVYDSTVFEGKIVLIDGVELAGKVKYDYKEGLLSFKDDINPRALQPEDVAYFEFIHPTLGKKKVYYSIEYRDPDTGSKDFHFFEVMKELKNFAVVAKLDRIHATSYGLTAPALASKDYKKMSQTETIFFLTNTMELKPYVKIVEDETEGMVDFHYKMNVYIDKDLFEEFTGSYYPRLEEFAEKNQLSFKGKRDIITILEAYEAMTK